MSIHFQINIEGETTDDAIAEFRKVFGGLLGAAPPVTGGVTGGATTEPKPEITQPAKTTRKPRGANKDAADKVETGEAVKTDPLADASNAEKTESASTSSTTETSEASASSWLRAKRSTFRRPIRLSCSRPTTCRATTSSAHTES